MPPVASGLFKQVAYKKEVTFGTPPGATLAQLLRRVQSTLDLSKDTYQSNEIRPDFQVADFRHGVRRVSGSVSGELSPKTYADFFGAVMKRDFAAVAAISGAGITVAGSGPTYTITRAAGSFITDGFKVGTVFRMSAGSFSAPNLAKNLFIVGLTALVATVLVLNGSALTAEGPISGSTLTAVGKKTFVPQSGHTDQSFTFEHFFADLGQSEVFTGCKPSKISVSLPPTGIATIGIDFMGKDIVTAAAQYFTSPGAITTTSVLAAVNGVVRAGGATVASLTGLSFDINAGQTGDPVVGSNTVPALYPGRVLVSGSFTAYFDSITLRDAFINETEIDLYAALTSDNSAAADFLVFGLPRIKVGSATTSDGETGLVKTFSFTALLNVNGGAAATTDLTTMFIQDSAA